MGRDGTPAFYVKETREQMLARVMRAQIDAIEPPSEARSYDLGSASMLVSPNGGGRYSVEVTTKGSDTVGRGRTAMGGSLGRRKSVTWDQLVEFAKERAVRGI